MAYAPHSRITLSGTLGTVAMPVEAWAVNLSFANAALNSQADVDQCWTAADTFMQDTLAHVSNWCHLRQVKFSSIDANGKLIGNAIVHNGLSVGSSSTTPHPPQIALVASLLTGQRGGSKRGRIYLPMPALNLVQDTMSIQDGPRAEVEGAVVRLIHGLTAALGSPGPVVASSKGYNTSVTSVRVGKVLDTVRSRRRSMDELYDVGTTL